jgi:hypothetical protein
MHYIVCPLRPANSGVQLGATALVISDRLAKKCLTEYDTDQNDAIQRAERLARENPGVQFAVFAPVQVFETVPQPQPPVIRKRITDAGEIVVDK